jgi:CTP synthase
MVKYVLITGGVLSGVGKGIIASSVGRIMKEMGFNVTAIKIDPYINIDAGTMSPFEHGEVFVLDDGGEVDLDLGNYERFMDITLCKDNNITTGKIYNQVIQKERRGDYLGKTVQVVPHICNEIQDWIEDVAGRSPLNNSFVDGDDSDTEQAVPDVCVVELGGTVGDIESMPFIEAMRQFQFRVGRDNICEIHVSLVPVIGVVGEQKTKPTQQSVRELRALGLSPDIICCRSENPLIESTKQKISSFCHVSVESVIGVHNVDNIYTVPILLTQQSMHKLICQKLKLTPPVPLDNNFILKEWTAKVCDRYDEIRKLNTEDYLIKIALVGKYTHLPDSYTSVTKALNHASLAVKRKLRIVWVEASELENPSDEGYENAWKALRSAHGVLVPGGFGNRGTEGKILAARYARENKKPYLGICLGMQLAVIEFARHVLGLSHAHSEEFEEKDNSPQEDQRLVIFMPEIDRAHMGGTMRLGKRKTIFKENAAGSTIAKLYGAPKVRAVNERHRHRYEVNPKYVPQLEEKGLIFVGQDETGQRQEIIELLHTQHPYFVGVQYHPEFKSRPTRPSPPFVGLLLAASNQSFDQYIQSEINTKEL